MKRLIVFLFSILFLVGCAGRIAQLEQSGLNIDAADSNDAVDAAYGGTNIDSSSSTGFVRVDSGVWSFPKHYYQTLTAFTNDDLTPDVSAGEQFRCSYTGTVSITDFDGTALQDGRRLLVYFDEDMSGTVTIDLTSSGIEAGNRTRDLRVKPGEVFLFVYSTDDNQWHMVNAPDDNIQKFNISFDPKAVCDGAVDRLFLFTVRNTNGYKIISWSASFEADPTTEADLDLKRADAIIDVGNAAVMDVMDTSAGVSSESTEANINSNVAVVNGKIVYLEFGTAYTETTHQINVEVLYEEVR